MAIDAKTQFPDLTAREDVRRHLIEAAARTRYELWATLMPSPVMPWAELGDDTRDIHRVSMDRFLTWCEANLIRGFHGLTFDEAQTGGLEPFRPARIASPDTLRAAAHKLYETSAEAYGTHHPQWSSQPETEKRRWTDIAEDFAGWMIEHWPSEKTPPLRGLLDHFGVRGEFAVRPKSVAEIAPAAAAVFWDSAQEKFTARDSGFLKHRWERMPEYDREVWVEATARMVEFILDQNITPVVEHAPATTRVGKQVGGTHYEDMPIQPWDIIRAHGLSYWAGNCLKYLLRAGKKLDTPALVDLKKARDYLDQMIADEEAIQARAPRVLSRPA